MVGGEDVLFRPILHKVLAPERLLDGSVDLAFIMLLNEAIDIEQENMYRAAKARQRKE
jgi:hypothetical protein